MEEKIQQLKARNEEINQQLQDPSVTSNPNKLRELNVEQAELAKVLAVTDRYEKFLNQKKDAEALAKEEDQEMRELAEVDIAEAEKELEDIQEELKRALLPRDPKDSKSAILEIRAGAGGDEAALFASNLFRMYSRYAEVRGWKMNILSSNQTGIGGFKEVIAEVQGPATYGELKFESGVHRVQRVPETEKSGRVHTSTATVAILPEVEDVDIVIKPEDLRVDVFRSGGNGGQVREHHRLRRAYHPPPHRHCGELPK